MPSPISPADLARLIDHTLLRADATAKEIEKLCAELAKLRTALGNRLQAVLDTPEG